MPEELRLRIFDSEGCLLGEQVVPAVAGVSPQGGDYPTPGDGFYADCPLGAPLTLRVLGHEGTVLCEIVLVVR